MGNVKNFLFSITVSVTLIVPSVSASNLEQESCGTFEMVGIVKSSRRDQINIVSSPKTFSEILINGEIDETLNKYNAGSVLKFSLQIQKHQKFRYKLNGKVITAQEITLVEYADILNKHQNSIVSMVSQPCEL